MVHAHHIGCQVLATEWDGEKDLRGMVGILRSVTDDGDFGLVEYPTNVGGNDGLDQQGNKVAKSGYCYWHKVSHLAVKKMPENYSNKVQEDYKHRGKNLKGMSFKFVGTLPNGVHVVVEFKEDVGGHSADGHGKKGRCLILPAEVIQKK